MEENQLKPDLVAQVKKLEQKYAAMGQDLSSYLDGLLYADYLTYWDYIHLDTLLSLQNPKTPFPDEKIFIVYHQITELYFNLILWELEQLAMQPSLTEDFFIQRLDRVNRYFHHLRDSFEIMVNGMDKDQFLKFRMALLPASGFQSAQYRLIEIAATDLLNLVHVDFREHLANASLAEQLQKLYWRSGATELASGTKTLTLRQFEEKYDRRFEEAAEHYKARNLRQRFNTNFTHVDTIKVKLREFDELANVLWPLAHMKSAGRYLHKTPEDIRATGGTNWQKYLPPRFQKVMFFPELWTEQEKAEWGRAGVAAALANE